MREMYFTSQPMKITDLGVSEGTFRAMDAEHTLLWSSDRPHWEFDLPGRPFQLPFLFPSRRGATSWARPPANTFQTTC
jgi:uncharacterized protein